MFIFSGVSELLYLPNHFAETRFALKTDNRHLFTTYARADQSTVVNHFGVPSVSKAEDRVAGGR